MLEVLSRGCLRMVGWRCVTAAPEPDRYVLIAAPHTSHLDFPVAMAVFWSLGVRPTLVGSHLLFRYGLGGVLRRMGSIPVERGQSANVVDRVVQLFAERERLALVISPEAYLHRTDHWKSGFYHIAERAGVPIVPSYLDWPTRTGGFGPPLRPGGDVRRDMDVLRAFYADKVGRHPDCFGPVRLREEATSDGAAQRMAP